MNDNAHNPLIPSKDGIQSKQICASLVRSLYAGSRALFNK